MNKRLRDMCQTEMNRDGADILTIGKPYERKNISSQTIFLPLCFVILIESAFNPQERRENMDGDFLLLHRMQTGDDQAIESFVREDVRNRF